MRSRWLILAIACAGGCSAPRSPAASPSPGTAAVRFVDHLTFGLRLESIAVALDGRPVYRNADAARVAVPRELSTLRIGPGVHAVTMVARVSMACGLLAEPRATVTLRASDTFRSGDAPASVAVDLFARDPIADSHRLVAVDFHGQGVVLGVHDTRSPLDAVHAECVTLEPIAMATCDLEAFAAEARATEDLPTLACYQGRLREMRRLRAVLDETARVAAGPSTTNEEAMHAQLRARYADARIHELAAEAKQCVVPPELAGRRGVDYQVDDECPPMRTALGDTR